MNNSFVSASLAASLLLTVPAFGQDAAMPTEPTKPSAATQEAPATPAAPTVAPNKPTASDSAKKADDNDGDDDGDDEKGKAPNTAAAVDPADPFGVHAMFKEWQDSALLQTYFAVNKELQPIFIGDANMKEKVAALDGFSFSGDTKKKLADLFGNDNPLRFTTKKLANGSTNLLFVLDKLDYVDPKTASATHTSPLNGKATFNKQFSKVHAVASMRSVGVSDGKTIRIGLSNLSVVSDRSLGLYDMWLGNATVKLDRMEIGDIHSKANLVRMNGIAVQAVVKSRADKVDIGYDYRIKSTSWGSDGLGPIHVALRLVDLDAKKMAEFTEKVRTVQRADLSQEEMTKAVIGPLKEFGLDSLKQGAAIEIQDISAQYHGLTAGLNGRIGFNGLEDSDFASPIQFMQKVVARINIHVPVKLVTTVSRIFAVFSSGQQGQDVPAPNAKQLDQIAMKMADAEINQVVKVRKWARIENGTLLTTIEMNQGKLMINGQQVEYPGSK